MGAPPTAPTPARDLQFWLLALWSAGMLILGASSAPVHDYSQYIGQWQLLLDGADPWSTDNTYGPLHTLLAIWLPLGPLAPKLFALAIMLLANVTLFRALWQQGSGTVSPFYWLLVPGNYLVVGIAARFGLNDTLVAGLMAAAVLLRHRGYLVLAGISIALAALVKYYPILVLPFFALDGGKIRWRLIWAGVLVFASGMGAAYLAWGDGLLDALRYGVNRPPKMLSIMKGVVKVLGDSPLATILVAQNSLMVLAGVGISFLASWWRKVNWLSAAVIGYLVMLLLYKVGHQQFYLPWLFMVAALPLVSDPRADGLARTALPLALFLSVFHIGYDLLSDGYRTELYWARRFGSLLAFPLGALPLLLAVYRGTASRP